mgnify:CR=1 FL=1
MRTLLIALCIHSSSITNAQPLERIEVVTFDSSRTATEIYRAAERWFIVAFPEPSMFSMRDSTVKTIVARRTVTIPWAFRAMAPTDMPFTYSMEVQIRDGRYKVRVYDVWFNNALANDQPCCFPKCTGGGKAFEEANLATCKAMRETPDALITSLKTAIANSTAEDW